MNLSHCYGTSSIGKKQIMAITGLGLLGFTATHLIGNILIFFGADLFNQYSHALTSNKLIYLAEAALAGMFLAHVILAIITKVENAQARPVRYYVKTRTGRGESFASMTMPITGVIILIFIILHLLNFKFGTQYTAQVNGESVRDIYRTVIEYFANPIYVAWYVFAVCALGLHTSHGLQSAFQTLGLSHNRYTPLIQGASLIYGAVVALGFSSMAIYCYFQN